MHKDRAPRRLTMAPDLLGVAALLAIIGTAVGLRWYYDTWITEYDRFTQFLAWYPYMGERLRDFEVPLWSPFDASGAPFAASPNSGWGYLPVMLAFTLIKDAITAYKTFVLLQSILAAVATYILSRFIGLTTIAAMTSSATFAIGPLLFGATAKHTVPGQLMVFIPIGILAVEGGMRSTRWSSRLAWSALGAIGLVNMFAGSSPRLMYGVMYIGGWLAYRCLFPANPERSEFLIRLKRALSFGSVMTVFAATFGAVFVWPTLVYNPETHAPSGDYSQLVNGNYAAYTWPLDLALTYIVSGNNWEQRAIFLSAPILMLALTAIIFGTNRYGIPFFAMVAFIMLDLTTSESILRPIFYLVPGFEHINAHRPTATANFHAFATSMLAGAAVQLVLDRAIPARKDILKVFPLLGFLMGVFWLTDRGFPVEWWQIWTAILTIALIFVASSRKPVLKRRHLSRIAQGSAIGLFIVAVLYPTLPDAFDTIENPGAIGPGWKMGEDHYISSIISTQTAEEVPGTAAEFLQRQQSIRQPFRYVPFSGTADPGPERRPVLSRMYDESIVAILANGRATTLGLEQTTGYNPIYVKTYVDYIDVMNGSRQDYHFLDVMIPAVSGSPLLDMLNVRYVLVPAALQPQPQIAEAGNEVYRDNLVVIYENPNAFPRAWIVHDVQPAMDGQELQLLNTGQVDGRVTAFVHGDLPQVSAPDPNGPVDSVVVTSYEPETIELSARSTGDGLLVLSEVYASGWNAYVDGERVEVLRTNHALRGVPLAAGEHEVVLKYEPLPLRIGLWSTGLSSIAMIGVWIWAGIDWQRRRRTSGDH